MEKLRENSRAEYFSGVADEGFYKTTGRCGKNALSLFASETRFPLYKARRSGINRRGG